MILYFFFYMHDLMLASDGSSSRITITFVWFVGERNIMCSYIIYVFVIDLLRYWRAQVVGWPPVRLFRKKALEGSKYVKVAADGAPYLRKVDLETYESYQELLKALEQMFTCFAIRGEYILICACSTILCSRYENVDVIIN
jgi:hypothetical protein